MVYRLRSFLYGKISPAMVEPEELPEYESPQVTNISHAEVQSVKAELVRMHEADAESITAGQVEMDRSMAGSIKAEHVSTRITAIGMLDADEAHVSESAVGFVDAEKVSTSGYTGAIAAGTVDVQNSAVGYLVGREVRAENVRTILLLARNVQGNVTTMLDTRGVLIAGLVGGLFSGLMLLLGRFLLRRN